MREKERERERKRDPTREMRKIHHVRLMCDCLSNESVLVLIFSSYASYF